MKIDPGNKIFISIFTVIVLGVIGFLIASIFISSDSDETIKTIAFSRSKFSATIKRLKDDKQYVIGVYNGDKWLQNVNLGNDFGDKKLELEEIHNGWKIYTNSDNEISFTVDVDSEDFSSLYVRRRFRSKERKVTDCLFMDPENLNWYGGPENKVQRYPIQKIDFFTDYAYVPKELDSAAIMERYWFSSNGFFILVDYDAPLFIDQNSENPGYICFTGKKALPYYIHDEEFNFNYRIGAGVNARETHLNVINRMLGKPIGLPDERLIRYPIWNTWVRYGRPINEGIIADFAEEIIQHGFKYSLLDIDDFWDVCYGGLTVNQTTFGNLKNLTDDLHSKDFIIGMWVHPFINKDCEPFYSYAKDNGLLVRAHNGSTDTSWWNSEPNQAAHVDFTNPQARSWVRRRLEDIQNIYGVDIFKFDAGETSFFIEDPVLTGDPSLSPSLMTRAFVGFASDFGNLPEVRTGYGTQYLPVLVRMLDFDSRWDEINGIKSLVATLIQFNLNGYVFVLPDMIGGNRYGSDQLTKNLFIRWVQASALMPALQFSVSPWDYDGETIAITQKFTKLHEDYADLVLERFRLAVSDGHPVNPPIWWLDPEDKEAQAAEDEFLLGENVLAAPVIEQDKYERDIYLPVGRWRDGNNNQIYEGKQWIRNYQAPLDVLPYFIREN